MTRIETIEAVADAYQIEWLIVDVNDSVPALAPVVDGEARPPWIGPPIATIPGPAASPGRSSTRSAQAREDQRCVTVALAPAGGAP